MIMRQTEKQKARLRQPLSPGAKVVLAFLGGILLGTVLLSLPVSHTGAVPVRPFDALFTATSAICVTGLAVVETGTAFSPFGQAVILLLIQVGGLGVAVLGVSVAMLSGRHMSLRARALIRESWNVGSFGGLRQLLRKVLILTISVESAGALAFWACFARWFPAGKALWIGAFHAVSAFNNAGFDILGRGDSLISLGDDLCVNLLTAAMVITGGLGYLVLFDLFGRRKRKLQLHTKVVLLMTGILLAGGTVVLYLTEDISLIGAFFQSMSARTAGFSTRNLAAFSKAGIFALCVLMFIGASPGSTGGGVKTTTVFALGMAICAASSGTRRQAFHRRVPGDVVEKAFLVVIAGITVLLTGTFLLCIFEPGKDFLRLMFETVSAFGTVGVSMGLTPELCTASRCVVIVLMFLGRLGPMTVAAMWAGRQEPAFRYSEERIPIG